MIKQTKKAVDIVKFKPGDLVMNIEEFRVNRQGNIFFIEKGSTFKITREVAVLRSQKEVYYQIEDKNGNDISPTFYYPQTKLLPADYEAINKLSKRKWFQRKDLRSKEDMTKEYESWINK